MESSSELSFPDTILSPKETVLLRAAQEISDTILEPRAESVDTGDAHVWDNLEALAQAGLVGVTTPAEYGGAGASGAFLREFTEILTAACGTTWFILTQHLGSCGQVYGSENKTLRERFLRDMAAGRHYVGVGFGHLRRPQPMLNAQAAEGGYILNGVAPWVTGWPILSGVIFGATLPDTRHDYLYAPAEEKNGMSSTLPLPLCAMNATATTEVTLRDYFVPQENWVRFGSREGMAQGDRSGVASNVNPPLGCARGSLKTLRGLANTRNLPAMHAAADALETEIRECRENARQWAEAGVSTPRYDEEATAARVWAIELGVRAAHMAVAAASGGANSLAHPAQRRFREAMFYTLTAQTGAILEMTLARLSHRSESR